MVKPPSLVAPGHNQFLAYGEQCRFVASQEKNLASGPEMRLQALRASGGKSFIIVQKGQRKLLT